MTRHGIGTTPDITDEEGKVVMKGGTPRIEDWPGAEVGGDEDSVGPGTRDSGPSLPPPPTADLSAESRRVELCQCPGCGRETQIKGTMAHLSVAWVIVIPTTGYKPPLCPVCGLKPGEPDA